MPQSEPIIAVVGSYVVGLTIRAPRFPVVGETLIGSDFDLGPGGKGSNQAIGITRMGGKCFLLVKIGTDTFADTALSLYQQENIDISNVIQINEANTGVAVITLNQQGENHIILDIGANAYLEPGDVTNFENKIMQSDVVLSVLEIHAETAMRAMALGRKHGKLTILNPAPASKLPDEILSLIDVLTPNETELKILLGKRPDDEGEPLKLARELQRRGARNIVVTQGSSGALVLEHTGSVHQVPGIKVDVVDTTGAGDAFNAALATALGRGEDLVESVRFAVIAGGLCCTKLGVIHAMPRQEDITSKFSGLQ
jgi:ribokinase